jgi:hypothetical protein
MRAKESAVPLRAEAASMSRLRATLDTVKPTYEELEFMLGQRDNVIASSRKRIRELEDEKQQLRFILKGMCLDTLELRVTISPDIFDQKGLDAVQYMVRNHAKAAAHEIEQKMGAPLQRLRDALLHINYLENHATRHALPFSPFGLKENDRAMMDSY